MIAPLFALLLAQPAQVSPCAAFDLPLTTAEYKLYLDPSDENRSAVTRSVLARLLPMISAANIRAQPEVCFCANHLMNALDRFGDEEAVERLISPQLVEYNSVLENDPNPSPTNRVSLSIAEAMHDLGREAVIPRYPKTRSSTSLSAARNRARSSCREGALQACTLADAAQLIWDNDAGASSFIRKFLGAQRSTPVSEALLLWQRSITQGDNRSAGLISILTRDDEWPATVIARRWAMDELVGDRDPRKWRASDVALVVVLAQRDDQLVAEDVERETLTPASTLVFPRPVSAERSVHHQQLLEYLLRLAPMGYSHVFELVHPQTVKGPEPELDPIWDHFPGEESIYRSEWNSLHNRSSSEQITESEFRDLRDYTRRRWSETDAKAPRIDFEALPLKLRDAKKLLPTSATPASTTPTPASEPDQKTKR